MEKKKYVDPTVLQYYDSKIKTHIDNKIKGAIGDETSLPEVLQNKTINEKINEVFQSSNNAQNDYETAIIGKGGTVSKAGEVASKSEILSGIDSIPSGDGGVIYGDGEFPIYSRKAINNWVSAVACRVDIDVRAGETLVVVYSTREEVTNNFSDDTWTCVVNNESHEDSSGTKQMIYVYYKKMIEDVQKTLTISGSTSSRKYINAIVFDNLKCIKSYKAVIPNGETEEAKQYLNIPKTYKQSLLIFDTIAYSANSSKCTKVFGENNEAIQFLGNNDSSSSNTPRLQSYLYRSNKSIESLDLFAALCEGNEFMYLDLELISSDVPTPWLAPAGSSGAKYEASSSHVIISDEVENKKTILFTKSLSTEPSVVFSNEGDWELLFEDSYTDLYSSPATYYVKAYISKKKLSGTFTVDVTGNSDTSAICVYFDNLLAVNNYNQQKLSPVPEGVNYFSLKQNYKQSLYFCNYRWINAIEDLKNCGTLYRLGDYTNYNAKVRAYMSCNPNVTEHKNLYVNDDDNIEFESGRAWELELIFEKTDDMYGDLNSLEYIDTIKAVENKILTLEGTVTKAQEVPTKEELLLGMDSMSVCSLELLNQIEQAIKDKGGTITKAGDKITFTEILSGINSIVSQ